MIDADTVLWALKIEPLFNANLSDVQFVIEGSRGCGSFCISYRLTKRSRKNEIWEKQKNVARLHLSKYEFIKEYLTLLEP